MSSAAELAELHELIDNLRRCVTSLKARYGDVAAMRRIAVDTERILSGVELLESDADDLGPARYGAHHAGEKIPVPDTAYDAQFWRDVDDEGVGGRGGQGRYRPVITGCSRLSTPESKAEGEHTR